jgi:protein-S-isoprenylcysteine O-methyltransferase Ste14
VSDVAVDPGLIRAVALFGPVGATAALAAWRRPSRALATGAMLATAWAAPALLALHVAAAGAGWWRYEAQGGLAAGMPVDLLIGWMLLWGAIPVLAFPRGPLVAPVATVLLLDTVLMPLAEPIVVLGDLWLAGELAGLLVVLVPGVVLARWTTEQRRLPHRVVLQVVLTGALLLWLVPLLALDSPAGVLGLILDAPLPIGGLTVAALTLGGLLGVAGVQEFAERGGGTPIPFDPPRRLVRTGPYAYIRNPMQTGACLILLTIAASGRSAEVAMAVVVALAYGYGVASWHEGDELRARFGQAWTDYRGGVRSWWPSWRPASTGAPATLWVAATCGQCRSVGRFFDAPRAVRLNVRPAEEHPTGALRRLTYEADGRTWDGLAAVARALEHVHLAWAMTGWALRLPGVCYGTQVLVDAAGGGPRGLCAAPPRAAQAPADRGLRDRTRL